VKSRDVCKQAETDKLLIELDGTANKAKLGTASEYDNVRFRKHANKSTLLTLSVV
jgi:hypothetical protein